MEANALFGRPWKVEGRFDSFEAADEKRKQLAEQKDIQVKVKKQLKGFVVKTRSTIVEEVKEEVVKKSSRPGRIHLEKSSRKKQRKERRNDR